MKFYRVIKLDKSGKRKHKNNSDDNTNPMTIRHKVKVDLLKPRKLMKKLWGYWL